MKVKTFTELKNVYSNMWKNDVIGFDRKRRIPYYFPRYGQFSRQMAADDDLEEMEGKFTTFSVDVKQTILSGPLK